VRSVISVLLVLCLCAGAFASGLQAVPNSPVASGDQLWVVDNGRVIRKLNDSHFIRGDLVTVGTVQLGDAAFCRPQPQPQAPAPPAFDTPPPFKAELESSGIDLGNAAFVLALVAGGVAGLIGYHNQKAEEDVKEDTEAADVAEISSA
jgi:hypothetical protein